MKYKVFLQRCMREKKVEEPWLRASDFMINSAHKSFYRSIYWHLTQQSTDVFTLFPYTLHDSSDIEFDVVMKILLENLSKQWAT